MEKVEAGRSVITSDISIADEQSFSAARVNNTTSKDVQGSKDKLITLPAEIHTMIFKELDRVGSTCLGLASKRLYSIHKGLHGKVSLTAWCLLPSRRYSGRHLYELLGEWMAPLMFCRPKRKFITAEKMGKFKEQYYALGGFWRRVDAMDSRALDEMMMARIEAELRVGGRFDRGLWVDGSNENRSWGYQAILESMYTRSWYFATLRRT